MSMKHGFDSTDALCSLAGGKSGDLLGRRFGGLVDVVSVGGAVSVGVSGGGGGVAAVGGGGAAVGVSVGGGGATVVGVSVGGGGGAACVGWPAFGRGHLEA